MNDLFHTWTPEDMPQGLKAKYEVTGTNLYGCDTGRRRFLVKCLDCNEVLHIATTGPNCYIKDHDEQKHK